MGGCASKSKVLRADAGDAPPPVAEESVAAVSEAKQVAVVEKVLEEEKTVQGGDCKDKEIVDDDKVDEHSTKRRSLSLLFKENEEGKDSAKDDKTPSEPVEQLEEPTNTEKATEEPETKLPEAEKPETPVEEAPAPVVVDARKEAETEVVAKAPEPAQAVEMPKPETSEEKKPKEEEKEETAENVNV